MKISLVYSSTGESRKTQFDYTTNDSVIISQFNRWRYGEHLSPVEDNEVLYIDSWHEYNRADIDIWKEAEKCLSNCVSIKAKRYFRNIIAKYRNKVLYGY